MGNFFGLNDSWVNIKQGMVFLSENQVLELLKPFEIIKLEEIETDKKTGLGELKHWHIYDIIARKKENRGNES